MSDFLEQLDSLRHLTLSTAENWIDIAIVAYVIYRLLNLMRTTLRGTRSWRIILGVASYVLLLLISDRLGLKTMGWLLEKGVVLGPVALVIVFLPEIRQALESFGKLWPSSFGIRSHAEGRTIEEIVAAVAELAATQVGALIVLERTATLDEVVATGVPLNARVTAALLNSIFFEGNPLHDGAAVVRYDLIAAAACRLPLSESRRLDRNVHMRHRAGVGVTESSDAIAVIVSEERGTISVATDGRLRRLSGSVELRDFLESELRGDGRPKDGRRRLRPTLMRRSGAGRPKTQAPTEAANP